MLATLLVALLLQVLLPSASSSSSSSSSSVSKATGPPPFFLQDPRDGLCLSGSTFKRCSLDTLWFVVGEPGSYQIHKRVEAGAREQCLSKKTCSSSSATNEELKLSKCTHCGAKQWNILGDADNGYVLTFDNDKTCLVREPGTNKALATSCESETHPYTPLHLNFAHAEDIKVMSGDGARLVNMADDGDLKAIKKFIKEGVKVDERDWDQGEHANTLLRYFAHTNGFIWVFFHVTTSL